MRKHAISLLLVKRILSYTIDMQKALVNYGSHYLQKLAINLLLHFAVFYDFFLLMFLFSFKNYHFELIVWKFPSSILMIYNCYLNCLNKIGVVFVILWSLRTIGDTNFAKYHCMNFKLKDILFRFLISERSVFYTPWPPETSALLYTI